MPDAWGGGAPSGQYAIGVDRRAGRARSAAAFISSSVTSPQGLATITQGVRADDFRGKRVRWSGWVKPAAVQFAGLWMRVDGTTTVLAFDNMQSRPIEGTSDWHEASVVLDVADNALAIAYGVLTSGAGDLLIDDLRLEIVGSATPVTDMLTGPVPSGTDSVSMTATAERTPRLPRNLDFEGEPPLSAAAIAWLRNTTALLTSTVPTTDVADLQPLRQMIGDARIVGLGEGSHGTSEFFQMKHRLLRFMVQEMGYTHFAIEATSPESDEVNRYVLTGEGNAATVLKNLYFWTWNTQEVLDMIHWMRQWNSTAPPDKRVQFLGFDMQYPGAAIDTVTAFVHRVAPSADELTRTRLACIEPYRNNGPRFTRTRSGYAVQTAAVKAACRAALVEFYNDIQSHQTEFEAASSAAEFARALHAVRLVQQFEEMIATPSAGSAARDRAMAENVRWLMDQAGPSARMVLWAHNFHVANRSNSMGGHLRSAYGASYRNLGFVFGRGRVTALGPGSLGSWPVQLVPDRSLEAGFLATGKARALLDARTIPASPDATAFREIPMRSIGAGFFPSSERAYFATHFLPDDFDLLIFIESSSSTAVLPF